MVSGKWTDHTLLEHSKHFISHTSLTRSHPIMHPLFSILLLPKCFISNIHIRKQLRSQYLIQGCFGRQTGAMRNRTTNTKEMTCSTPVVVRGCWLVIEVIVQKKYYSLTNNRVLVKLRKVQCKLENVHLQIFKHAGMQYWGYFFFLFQVLLLLGG